MTLAKPYGGRDVDEVVSDCDAGYREYSRTIPQEDLSGFNPAVSGYGTVWSCVCDKASLPWLVVLAGVVGNMTGVPVAMFDRVDADAACQFSRDFEAGKCFVLCNGPRWNDYVNAMQKTRKVNADIYSRLNSLSRSSGISSVSGNTITQHQLRVGYLAGLTAEQI